MTTLGFSIGLSLASIRPNDSSRPPPGFAFVSTTDENGRSAFVTTTDAAGNRHYVASRIS